MNLLKITAAVFSFLFCPYVFASDTLRRDSLMQTTGIKLLFKGGTAYNRNTDGLVTEGTLRYDTDLWTTGPLVMFSSSGTVRFNPSGRVTDGVLSLNILADCADNHFRVFKRGTRIFFGSDGLVRMGTLNESIDIAVIDGEMVRSAEGSPVEFYPGGGIKRIVPSANFKFTSKEGIKFTIAAATPVKFSPQGHLTEGYLAKKVSFTVDGQAIYMSLGQCVRFSEDGSIVW